MEFPDLENNPKIIILILQTLISNKH